MEEEAELALLDQHLQQTNKLASSMTAILSRLDTRLTRLDKTIAPFGIQPLTREARNIDAALAILSGEKIRVDIKPQDNVSSRGEEGILSRMPEYSTLDDYIGAIDRVLRDIDRLSRSELRSSEGNIKDLCKLVELGGRNLVSLFLKFVRDGSSHTSDLEAIARDGPLPPPKLLPSLPLVTRISTSLLSLPTLTKHPNASSILHATIQSASDGYASIRREWVITRCMNPMMREFDEVVEGPMSPGREDETRKVKCKIVGKLLGGLMALMNGEHTLWSQIFQQPSFPGLTSIFSSPISLLSDLLTTQTSIIRKALSTHTFYALELYQYLIRIQSRWEDACRNWTGDLKALVMVADASAVLRGVCLRSFPEILVDVKSPPPASRAGDGGMNVAVSDVTYSTVSYLETLPTYENIVTTLLNSLGDRNWLMGAAVPASFSRSGGDDGIIQHFVTDLLAALSSQLESRSRSMKRPISSIYLLNNLSYIRNNLILSSSSTANDIIGEAGEDELNRAFRDAKQKYLDSWQGLAELLSDSATSGSSTRFGSVVGSDRQAVKDGLTNFFNRLEELEGISRQYGLSKQDPILRDRLRQDVKSIVVPALNAFVSKHTKMERYMRATPAEVENRLAALFQ